MVAEQGGIAAEQETAPETILEGTERVSFTVYGNPVPKERPRVAGHAYTPEKTKKHEEIIGLIYKVAYKGFKFEKGIPIRMEADFYLKTPKSKSKKVKEQMEGGAIRPSKRPDADNLLKTVSDALNELAYDDDSQIVEMIGRKYYSENPRTEIHIEKVGSVDAERIWSFA